MSLGGLPGFKASPLAAFADVAFDGVRQSVETVGERDELRVVSDEQFGNRRVGTLETGDAFVVLGLVRGQGGDLSCGDFLPLDDEIHDAL